MTYQEMQQLLANLQSEGFRFEDEQQTPFQYQGAPSLLDPVSQRNTPMPTRGTMDFIGSDNVMPFNPNMPVPEEKIFWGADNSKTLNLMAGGGTNESANARGFSYGGRLGTNIPLSEDQILSLGLSGGGMRQRYGIGKPYEGVEDQSKLQAIDATLSDLARNQEFMAQVKRDQNNVPFYSLAYRKRW